eukprot:2970881-Amphidinium_carterae.1
MAPVSQMPTWRVSHGYDTLGQSSRLPRSLRKTCRALRIMKRRSSQKHPATPPNPQRTRLGSKKCSKPYALMSKLAGLSQKLGSDFKHLLMHSLAQILAEPLQ